jgi:hypothetical protein
LPGYSWTVRETTIAGTRITGINPIVITAVIVFPLVCCHVGIFKRIRKGSQSIGDPTLVPVGICRGPDLRVLVVGPAHFKYTLGWCRPRIWRRASSHVHANATRCVRSTILRRYAREHWMRQTDVEIGRRRCFPTPAFPYVTKETVAAYQFKLLRCKGWLRWPVSAAERNTRPRGILP